MTQRVPDEIKMHIFSFVPVNKLFNVGMSSQQCAHLIYQGWHSHTNQGLSSFSHFVKILDMLGEHAPTLYAHITYTRALNTLSEKEFAGDERLEQAAQYGSVRHVQMLLQDPRVEVGEDSMLVPIFAAWTNKHYGVLRILLQDAFFRVETFDQLLTSYISKKLESEDIKILKTCIEEKLLTPQFLNSYLFTRPAHPELLEVLLQESSGLTPFTIKWKFREACRMGNLQTVQRLLKDNRLINFAISEGLITALENGYAEIANILVKTNRIFEPFSVKTYWLACEKGYHNIVQHLLEHHQFAKTVIEMGKDRANTAGHYRTAWLISGFQ